MPEAGLESSKRKFSEKESLQDDLKEDKLNINKWIQLTDLVVQQEDATVEEVKAVFEEFLEIFKLYAPAWVKYIKFVISKSETQFAEQLFARCLTQILDVELYRCYVQYVIKAKDIVTGGDSARSSILSAFSFAVDSVGMDPDSELLWKDYLDFVDKWTPIDHNETQAKIDTKRNILRRLITVPSYNLPKWWSYYTNFENDTNSNTARTLINEKSSDYMNLRPIAQEFSNITRQLDRSTVLCKENTSLFKKRIGVWNAWIKWEKENKMKLATNALNKRINFAYKQSLQHLYFFPEVWCNYSNYTTTILNDGKLGVSYLTDGLKLNPQSFTLTMMLSETFEKDNDVGNMKASYSSLIQELSNQYDKLTNFKESLQETDKEKVQTAEKELKILSRSITYAYSLEMKAAKRMGGIKEARTIFSQARKFKGITWQVFVDYSMMEFHNNELKISLRSFELALKYFGKEIDFICKYMDFLIFIKDIPNVKTLFETSVKTFTDSGDNDSLKKLFNKFMKIQYNLSDLNSVTQLQERYLKIFTEDNLFDVLQSVCEVDSFNAVRIMDSHGSDTSSTNNEGPIAKKQMIDFAAIGDDIGGNDSSLAGNGFSNNDKPLETFVVGDEIYNLLRVLPKSQYYQQSIFDPAKTVEFFKTINI